MTYRTIPTQATTREKPAPMLYASRDAAIAVLRANDGKWRRASIARWERDGEPSEHWIVILDGAILRVDGSAQ